MRSSHDWLITAVLAAAILGPAAASPDPAPVAPPAASAIQNPKDVLDAVEDVAILKALLPLGLARAQWAALLPALEGAQAKLRDLDAKEVAKRGAWQGSLAQARRDLLAGKSSGARASDQFLLAQSLAVQKRGRDRADLAGSLQAALEKILTPAQWAQVIGSGQGVLLAQRTAGWQGGGPRGAMAGGGGAGGPGGGPGGGAGGPTGRLDRLREMSPADFDQFSQRLAGRMGGSDSPRFQQYSDFMNQVRALSPSQYALQRDQLAAQSPGRGGFAAALAGNELDAIRAFVDRYLLSPRAPIVVHDRLQSP